MTDNRPSEAAIHSAWAKAKKDSGLSTCTVSLDASAFTQPTTDRLAEVLDPCPWCGTTEHLSVQAVGSMTSDMPARPFRVFCTHIDHDTISGPVDYGRAGAIITWNRRPAIQSQQAEIERLRKQRAVEELERLIEGLEEMKSEMPDAFECLLLMPEVRQLRAALNPQPTGKDTAHD